MVRFIDFNWYERCDLCIGDDVVSDDLQKRIEEHAVSSGWRLRLDLRTLWAAVNGTHALAPIRPHDWTTFEMLP